MVFRHFPIETVHPRALLVSQAAEAAGAKGRFWDMHDKLFSMDDPSTDAALCEAAETSGLDGSALLEDVHSGLFEQRVLEDINSGRTLGVEATPGIFINGERYRGAWDIDSLDEALAPPIGIRVERAARRFSDWAASGGLSLVIAAVVALVWANLAAPGAYEEFWEQELSIGLPGFDFELSLRHWINDGLMVLFFIVVGLEIKRELLLGELADPRAAALPIAGAIGGMALPALIYSLFNSGGPGVSGWGVPMATDIAFAIGLLAMLGSRVPYALMIFVSALAIVDDLGAIVVIALFYTAGIDLVALGTAGAILAALILLARIRIRFFWPYVVLGTLLWLAVLASGIHATVAGVLLALVVPLTTKADPRPLLAQAATALHETQTRGKDANNPVPVLENVLGRLESPAERIRHSLEPWTAYFILPLFALANCGVLIEASALTSAGPVFAGTGLGLLIGKPLGIFLVAFVAVRIGLARAPESYSWMSLLGAAALCGVGFTMAVFIATAAFEGTNMLNEAKLGVLCGSFLAGLVGWALLARELNRSRQTHDATSR